MTDTPPLLALQSALGAEITALLAARDHAERGATIISALNTTALDRWTATQRALLAGLRDASQVRGAAMLRCLPDGAAAPPEGGLADRLAFVAILACAPPQSGDALRIGRDRLRGLRDELALLLARNEILLRDVLTFTETLPSALPGLDAPIRYTASGRKAAELPSDGDLLRVTG